MAVGYGLLVGIDISEFHFFDKEEANECTESSHLKAEVYYRGEGEISPYHTRGWGGPSKR